LECYEGFSKTEYNINLGFSNNDADSYSKRFSSIVDLQELSRKYFFLLSTLFKNWLKDKYRGGQLVVQRKSRGGPEVVQR
jgi:hypothetical protein